MCCFDVFDRLQGYLNPLLTHRDELLLTTLEISSLFGCIERVCAFSRELYDKLDNANLNIIHMGNVFVHNDSGFAVYADYCTMYPMYVCKLLICIVDVGV